MKLEEKLKNLDRVFWFWLVGFVVFFGFLLSVLYPEWVHWSKSKSESESLNKNLHIHESSICDQHIYIDKTNNICWLRDSTNAASIGFQIPCEIAMKCL